jgi:hypothetical protein
VGRGVRVGVGVGVNVGVGLAVGVGVGVLRGGTCEKVFAGLTNSPAAQSSTPKNAGIVNDRIPDCFRCFIEFPLSEPFVSIEQSSLSPDWFGDAPRRPERKKEAVGEKRFFPPIQISITVSFARSAPMLSSVFLEIVS